MKSKLFVIIFAIGLQSSFSQEPIIKEMDSLYKEDQFYIGITYNLLGKKPTNLAQTGFSTGFHFGYIRDMPINKRRNVAIGVGLGYSVNLFNQNMLIRKDNTDHVKYSILDDSDGGYSKNKFSLHMVEVPIEFRWRTSTTSEYKFWRVYAGFKLGYIFAHTTNFKGDLATFKYKNIKDFNNIQYGLTLSAGYNTWNIYMYYALNPIFSSDAKIDETSINMNAIKLGLIFYIL